MTIRQIEIFERSSICKNKVSLVFYSQLGALRVCVTDVELLSTLIPLHVVASITCSSLNCVLIAGNGVWCSQSASTFSSPILSVTWINCARDTATAISIGIPPNRIFGVVVNIISCSRHKLNQSRKSVIAETCDSVLVRVQESKVIIEERHRASSHINSLVDICTQQNHAVEVHLYREVESS